MIDFRESIKKELKRQDKTQKWLVDELNKRGSKIDRASLSQYLNNKKRLTDPVIELIFDILEIKLIKEL